MGPKFYRLSGRALGERRARQGDTATCRTALGRSRPLKLHRSAFGDATLDELQLDREPCSLQSRDATRHSSRVKGKASRVSVRSGQRTRRVRPRRGPVSASSVPRCKPLSLLGH